MLLLFNKVINCVDECRCLYLIMLHIETRIKCLAYCKRNFQIYFPDLSYNLVKCSPEFVPSLRPSEGVFIFVQLMDRYQTGDKLFTV